MVSCLAKKIKSYEMCKFGEKLPGLVKKHVITREWVAMGHVFEIYQKLHLSIMNLAGLHFQ